MTLHEARIIDDYGSDEARAEARKQDTEDKWQSVPDNDIRDMNAVLSFLDPKGFYYYLPSYIIWYLRNVDNEDPDFDSNTFESLVFKLTLSKEMRDFDLSRFTLLTSEQSLAVAHFLSFDAERESAIY